MATKYEILYNAVSAKLKDYVLANMDEQDAFDVLNDYVRPAVSSFHTCKKNLADRDENEFAADLDDMEIDIITNYMVIAYIDANYISTPMALSQDLTINEFKSVFKGTLGQLLEMKAQAISDNETLLSRYSWRSVEVGTP